MGLMQTPMQQGQDDQWIALSESAGPVCAGAMAEVVKRGSLVIELTRPKDGGSVLLDHRTNDGWPRGFSIFHDADAGVVILHRQGQAVQRHILPGPLPRDWRLARLTYSWDGPARSWALRLVETGGAWSRAAHGSNPVPLSGVDILALCAGLDDCRRDASVQWFGVCLQSPQTAPLAWIGHRTPIDTARGRIAAGDLRLGDSLKTLDHGMQLLRGLHRTVLPNRGRFAPVLLRAPYFARQADVLVAQGQLVLLSGTAVDYLFGEDAVLAPAAALRDGNSALTDSRRQLTQAIGLDLGAPEVIFADGCPLLTLPEGTTAPMPYRVLLGYEAQTLQCQLGRGSTHYVA